MDGSYPPETMILSFYKIQTFSGGGGGGGKKSYYLFLAFRLRTDTALSRDYSSMILSPQARAASERQLTSLHSARRFQPDPRR